MSFAVFGIFANFYCAINVVLLLKRNLWNDAWHSKNNNNNNNIALMFDAC